MCLHIDPSVLQLSSRCKVLLGCEGGVGSYLVRNHNKTPLICLMGSGENEQDLIKVRPD